METISVMELKQKLDNGAPVKLIDVREPDERAIYNIGGIFLPSEISCPCKPMRLMNSKMKK